MVGRPYGVVEEDERWDTDGGEKGLRIRGAPRLILVQVSRMPSWKFDNKIRGGVD